MTALYELYEYLEKTDTEMLISQVNEFKETLSKQFGVGDGIRFLTHLNKLQNLHSVMKYNFENEVVEKPVGNISTNHKPTPQITPTPVLKPIDIDIPKENPHSNPNDRYKGMESGDIHFAAYILPYRVTYIRQLCRERLIPYEKPKGKYVFYKSKLEEWLQQNGSNHRLEMLSIGKRVNRKRG